MSGLNPWSWWVHQWSRTESAIPLALFRIAVSMVVVLDAISLLAAGVLDPLYMPIAEGGFAPANRFDAPLLWMLDHTAATTTGLCGAMLVLGVLALIGLGGRITHLALLQVVLAWHALPMDIGGGYDRLLTNALWLLVLGNCTATLSVDCWRKHGRWVSDDQVGVMARYLAVAQLSILYAATGSLKTGPGWRHPWDALFHSLQIDTWARFEHLPWLGHAWEISQLGTIAALWWERCFLVMLPWFAVHAGWFDKRARHWARREDLRWLILGYGLVVHGILGVFTNLGTFTTITLCFYLPFFTGEEFSRVWGRVRGIE